MAQLTITVPDAQVTRVGNACAKHLNQPPPATAIEARNAAREVVRRMLIALVEQYEKDEAVRTAEASITSPDIT